MHKKIISYIKNEAIIKSSIILLIATGVSYICAYLYHFYTGRVLGPVDYGIIGSLFSLLYIILVPFNAIQISITKFVSEFRTQKEYGKIKYLLVRSLKKLFLYGIIISLFFLLVSPWISNFLNLPSIVPLLILGLIIILSLLLPITRGVLQGLQDFKKLGLNVSIDGLGKIGFAVLLISLGFGVNGAIFALVLSFLVSFLIILWQLKDIFKAKEKAFNTKYVYKYSFPVLLSFLCLTLIFSVDILLVKHFFSAVDAGHYAALSIIGKIIFFASFPVMQVMFPMVSENNAISKKSSVHLLYKSLLIILLICIGITGFYFLFSNFMVSTLFGQDYLNIANLVGYFGIFISFFSISHLLVFYNLSLNKTSFLPLLIIANILEVVLIWAYHGSISQIAYSLIILSFLLLISLIIYTIKNAKTFSNHTSV
ncbi:MAG: oligosaccharide flippase family protein [Nanoarchaeota archaeon]|nr:oligosaccharide flippase family protein [Nanoarchaeota archaeon]